MQLRWEGLDVNWLTKLGSLQSESSWGTKLWLMRASFQVFNTALPCCCAGIQLQEVFEYIIFHLQINNIMQQSMCVQGCISFLASTGRKLEEHAVRTGLAWAVQFHNRDNVAKTSWMVNAYFDIAAYFYINHKIWRSRIAGTLANKPFHQHAICICSLALL